MCGIVTYIGCPTNTKAAHELTTALLKKTEIRGDNATGFWASQVGDRESDSIFYHKEPKRSSEFVNLDIWNELSKHKTNLLIAHCRKSSSGSENNNKNNHPFLSDDRRVALVHMAMCQNSMFSSPIIMLVRIVIAKFCLGCWNQVCAMKKHIFANH